MTGRAKTRTGRRTKAANKPGARELSASAVRWTCEPIEASTNAPKVTSLLGQPRAMTALRTGLGLRAPGYNIFVSGLMGSGRTRVVSHLIEEQAPVCRLGPDRLFVHNFRDPNTPRLLTLPRGRGVEFREDALDLVFDLREALRAHLDSRSHKVSRRLVATTAEARHKRLVSALERESLRRGCAVVEYRKDDEVSADILPTHDGAPRSVEEYEALVGTGDLTSERRDEVLRARNDLLERLEEISERTRRMFRQMEADLRAMDRRAAAAAVQPVLDEFAKRWPDEKIAEHLADLREQIEADLLRWLVDDDEVAGRGGPTDAAGSRTLHARLRDFQVLLLEGEPGAGCPVVIESNPTYHNLFGTIEPAHEASEWELGRIHVGSLFRADGGFLIMRAADVLSEPGVWQQLKRALKAGKIEVRAFDPSAGTTAGSLQPEAIPAEIKVVLIGEPGLYERLAHEDPQFCQLFKVHAEFDRTVENDAANRLRYADFLAWLADSEGLSRIRPDAAAAIAEFGARVAGRQDRLSTRFGELADIAREASHIANDHPVERAHVEQAIAMREARVDLTREHVERDMRDGYVLIRTSGPAVGQVNALTVLDTGSIVFGKPVRITASTGAASGGKSDVVNIEREAQLSGPLHDKGVLILQGFLLDRLGGERPIGLMATICFEQMYAELDGDSASCAELFALLSSLADVPIDQGIAVTGSLNQKGDIQPVGGVNEKIECFYRACSNAKLTGSQGVLIPRANAPDLMLGREVVEAIEQGRFHVYTMEHVIDGLELLTGLSADAVFARARNTLETYRAARVDDADDGGPD